ncbi:MAG TPA: hypothetical protein VFW65_18525 [Pseudonocardiaceae bacterium]|nr:hypothetical protein [Pseudonocardiaceae bacterium]
MRLEWPELALYLRPELTSLADEIIAEIRRARPEYAGRHGLRAGVEPAAVAFVDQVADPAAPQPRRAGACRALGRREAEQGRSLDDVQAAYRAFASRGND